MKSNMIKRKYKETLETLELVKGLTDGHYYDSDECWYCRYRDGVEVGIKYALGLINIENKNGKIYTY